MKSSRKFSYNKSLVVFLLVIVFSICSCVREKTIYDDEFGTLIDTTQIYDEEDILDNPENDQEEKPKEEEIHELKEITHIGTTQIRNRKGIINIQRPSKSKPGDLLVLFLHRTDDDLPLYVDGWTRVAECYKTDNGYKCGTKLDCNKWHDKNFCENFYDQKNDKNLGPGHDLAQSVFVRVVSSKEDNSYYFNLNRDDQGHPGWAILTALRGANNDNPVRDWSHTGCDKNADSLFPSVYGESGDMLLLSQSFDDAIAKEKFGAPSDMQTLGYVSGDEDGVEIDLSKSDEAGFLFGGLLKDTGDTGIKRTEGAGGPGCKDALVSLTIRPK